MTSELQAVEVKEGIDPGSFDVTAGSITYQVFFNFYKKLAGMTVRTPPPPSTPSPPTLPNIRSLYVSICSHAL